MATPLASTTADPTPSSTRRLLRDYGIAVGIAVTVAVLIRIFLVEAYRIPNFAMRPTLEAGDTIFVMKWNPHPLRGDVVIYSPPADPARDYIKRVVALGGETVSIKTGRLYIDGRELDVNIPGGFTCGTELLPGQPDGYAHGVCIEPPLLENLPPVAVPADSVFVLGDLRTVMPTEGIRLPAGKKTWGVVPLASIKGQARWIWLSIEPRSADSRGWFPQFRFERMLRRIR